MNCDKRKAPVSHSDEGGGMIPARYDDTELVELRLKVEIFETLFEEVEQCLPWMLEDIKHRSDMVNVGCYSDDLRQAMVAKNMLDLLKE